MVCYDIKKKYRRKLLGITFLNLSLKIGNRLVHDVHGDVVLGLCATSSFNYYDLRRAVIQDCFTIETWFR